MEVKMKNWLRKTAKIIAGMALCFLFLPGAAHAEGQEVLPFTAAMAPAAECAVYDGPSEESGQLGMLAIGQPVNVCGRTNDGWYRIVYGTGIGYVEEKAVTEIPVDDTMRQALAAQAAYVMEGTGRQAETGQTKEPSGQADPAGTLQPAVAPGSGNLIFVGDSRVGQMANAVGGSEAWPGVAFVACYGGGVNWFSSSPAKKEIDALVGPGSVIIINYGVNDLSRHGDYITTIDRYSRDWIQKGAAVYFASVGPVGENQYGKRNWAVEYFNDQLFNRLNGNIGRIDLYSYLTLTGYSMEADGIHYLPDTYARVFQYLMQSVGRM